MLSTKIKINNEANSNITINILPSFNEKYIYYINNLIFFIFNIMSSIKIKKIYDNISNRFEKLGGTELFYDYSKKDKLKPIIVANSEIELKSLLENKIKKNPEKYKDSKFVRIKVLQFPNNIGKNVKGGSFGLMAMVYNVSKDLELVRVNENRQQGFWYSDNELLNRGFSSKDIKMIIKAVYKNLVDMSPFKTYQISHLDKLFS